MLDDITTSPGVKRSEGFLAEVCAYFRDFLQTDFKRQQLPKRQIATKDGANNRVGIPLGRYPSAVRDLFVQLSNPVSNELRLKLAVGLGQHRSAVNDAIRAVITNHIDQVSEETTEGVADRTKLRARQQRDAFKNDPEAYLNQTLEELRGDLVRSVAVPTTKRLQTYFDTHATDGLEVAYSIEDEIGELLIDGCGGVLAAGLADALVKNDFAAFDDAINDLTRCDMVRAKLVRYFEGFSSSDLFRDLHELMTTTKLKENVDLYLYLGEIRFNKVPFPLFYLPLETKAENNIFNISAGPRLYVNKRALEFAAQEASRDAQHPIPIAIRETYVEFQQGKSVLDLARPLAEEWSVQLGLTPTINLATPVGNKAARSTITMTNLTSFAAFDKADEALVNDYENILRMLKAGGDIAADFASIVFGIIERNAVSIISDVETDWQSTPIPMRLVYESPVPLNEEQRKIMSALRDTRSRFIGIEGPPGTGKSHTITAMAFDAILSGRNVLILSDKKEALDVVEDKITSVLATVREGEDIKNPILRIGQSGSTYGEIVKPSSITAIRNHSAATRSQRAELNEGLQRDTATLEQKITALIQAGSKVNLNDVAKLTKRETELENRLGKLAPDFNDDDIVETFAAIQDVREILSVNDNALARILALSTERASLDDLQQLLIQQKQLANLSTAHPSCSTLLTAWRASHRQTLQSLLAKYEKLRLPLLGFLFATSKVSAINDEAGQRLPLVNSHDLHRHYDELHGVNACLAHAEAALKKQLVGGSVADSLLTQYILGIPAMGSVPAEVFNSIKLLQETLPPTLSLISRLAGISIDNIVPWVMSGDKAVSPNLDDVARLGWGFRRVRNEVNSAPAFDYASDKARLENLHVGRLAGKIDEHLVAFADNRQNDLSSIREILKRKQKFPEHLFGALKEAFPCIIAGIRDYAEYMPLAKGLFDLVIIDEASQVSIAQALPAFIRAKKVVVLGDRNQFSNVKTVNASKETNAIYANRILAAFGDGGTPDFDAATEERLKLFNIKTSVMTFVSRIADFQIMLRKHFRGYPELIAFSSDTFYRGQIQPMKIRARPIDQVIIFQEVPPPGVTLTRNVNEAEAQAIVEELKRVAQSAKPPSVGVITPFNEQQAFIAAAVAKLQSGRKLTETLKLKVMTFDTCQGEERDIVMYSMVATPDRDRLAYIFPSSLAQSSEVDRDLRLQRLNVGFSRAKETIQIFHSKPIGEFTGAIGEALRFIVEQKVRAQAAPETSETDPASPMEKQVLQWLRSTRFYRNLGSSVEIDAQFRVGEYLRQIDPRYKHPAYRADFLVKVSAPEKTLSIIVEYDGFKEHFTNVEDVTAHNYGNYYKPEDVERQKVLESYGYRFLRINRFNIGKDPIKTLDQRLAELARDVLTATAQHPTVTAVKDTVSEIQNGDRKICPRCGEQRALQQFASAKAKSGYGRICLVCRNSN